jgi:hypothetical protein
LLLTKMPCFLYHNNLTGRESTKSRFAVPFVSSKSKRPRRQRVFKNESWLGGLGFGKFGCARVLSNGNEAVPGAECPYFIRTKLEQRKSVTLGNYAGVQCLFTLLFTAFR